MKVISNNIIKSLSITPKQCTEWIYESFRLKAESQLPAKISVHPREDDFFTSMPCLLPPIPFCGSDTKIRFFGIKEVHRISGAVPSLGSDILLYNAVNGELLALIDADWITSMRTGAVAAVSAKALRKCNGLTYGFVGLGNTARATLACMLELENDQIFNVKLLKYKNQAEEFIERFRNYNNVRFETVCDIKDLVNDSDVLVSCITSADGLFLADESNYPKGITIIPVHMRGFQNCDTVFDRVLGDDTDHVRNFKFFNQFKGYAEIGEVLAGRDIGRHNDMERIIDYNYGLALHDIVFASKIYQMLQDINVPDIIWEKEHQKFWI